MKKGATYTTFPTTISSIYSIQLRRLQLIARDHSTPTSTPMFIRELNTIVHVHAFII